MAINDTQSLNNKYGVASYELSGAVNCVKREFRMGSADDVVEEDLAASEESVKQRDAGVMH